MLAQNPETALRRSQLLCSRRRAELFQEFDKVHQPYCHKTMNKDFYETGRSFRIKDNRIHLRHPSLHASTVFKTAYPMLEHDDQSYKNIQGTKKLWKSAMLDYKDVAKISRITKSSRGPRDEQVKVPNMSICHISKGNIEGSHCRTTNPGYSRNKTGGFYTR